MMENELKIVTSKTPLRITFAGGGTDIPSYYRKYGPGAVVSATINKYIYVTVAKNFYRDEIRVSYSKTENAIKNVEDIQHPTVRESLKLLDIRSGIQIISITEIPSRGTGLGSSSSFLVGLLNALHAWRGEAVSPKQLAEEAVKIEREILKEPGGKQDQYMAAFGGINLMEFFPDESVNIKKAKIPNEINEYLMMFFTGIERDGTQIHRVQRNLVDENIDGYNEARDLAYLAFSFIKKGKFKELGKLMGKNWQLKKRFSPDITNEIIDDIYKNAIVSGALGGKLQGAGGGGFFLFIVPPEKRESVKKSLSNYILTNIKLINNGSKIVYKEKGN
jgi:D-glycero-alpha-D-manno-heptose-7-phosphate kinase